MATFLFHLTFHLFSKLQAQTCCPPCSHSVRAESCFFASPGLGPEARNQKPGGTKPSVEVRRHFSGAGPGSSTAREHRPRALESISAHASATRGEERKGSEPRSLWRTFSCDCQRWASFCSLSRGILAATEHGALGGGAEGAASPGTEPDPQDTFLMRVSQPPCSKSWLPGGQGVCGNERNDLALC